MYDSVDAFMSAIKDRDPDQPEFTHITDPIPGTARINPSTTRRSDGAAEITRNTRKMRKARRTFRLPAPGT